MLLNYTVKGQGNKNLILLHGWGGSLDSLAPLQDELIITKEFRVYNVEWPGFGSSKFSGNQEVSFNDYVEALIRFIKSEKILKPTLVGHSFGGKVALGLSLMQPELISSMILVNSSGIKPKNSIKRSFFLVTSKVLGIFFNLPGLRKIKPLVRKFYYKIFVREVDYLTSGNMKEILKNVLEVNFDTLLPKIKINTLIIWGEKDTQTPLWMGQTLAKGIKNAKIEIVKNTKHNLPLINPEIVATLIRLYLK